MATGLGLVSTFGIALACGPSTSDPGTNTVSPSSSASSTSSVSTSSAAPSSTTETTSAEANACDGPGDAYVSEMLNDGICETTAPPNCLISEFAENFGCAEGNGGVGDCSECCWGDDTSLSGGAFTYVDSISGSEIEYTVASGAVTFAGTSNDYAGFGLWFGPCTDASMWTGLEIQVTGDLGGGALFVQLQTDQNYPTDGEKGSCTFTSEDEKWNECTNPQFKVETVTADGLSPIRIPWASFLGGKPNDGVDPKQLRGVQIQVGCDLGEVGSSDSSATSDSAAPASTSAAETSAAPMPCTFNFQLHDLRWYKE